MKQVGYVRKIVNDKAEVEVRRISSCGGGCNSCGGSCNVPSIVVAMKNPINAEVGDYVEIKAKSKNIIKYALIVYMIPFAMLILGIMLKKILGLRIFEDDKGKMNLSLLDIKGEILVVSQFTLYGDVRKGRRPSFSTSASPEIAENIYNQFIEKCMEKGIKTEKGIFGANMEVSLRNQGPVTILIDSKKTF